MAQPPAPRNSRASGSPPSGPRHDGRSPDTIDLRRADEGIVPTVIAVDATSPASTATACASAPATSLAGTPASLLAVAPEPTGTPSEPDRPTRRRRRLPAQHQPNPDPPALSTSRALAGRTVLMIGLGSSLEASGLATHTLEIADHLAAGAASVTLLTALPKPPVWRRRPLGSGPATDDPEPALTTGPTGPTGPIGPPDPTDPTDPADPSAYLHPGAGTATRRDARAVVVHLDHLRTSGPTTLTRAAYQATRLASAASNALPTAPDLVVATTPGLGGVVAAARVARRHHAPLVVLVHDLVTLTAGHDSVVSAMERHALACADAVVILGESLRATVESYGVDPRRIHLLPAWTDGQRSLLSRREARRRLGLPTRGTLVLTTDLRGQDLATVLACAKQLTGRRDVRFLVVGTRTPSRRAIHLRGGQSVLAVDALDPHRMADVLAAADLLLFSEGRAVTETGATTLLASYFGAGRPVIAAAARDGVAAREVARSSGAGVVVPPRDPAALAEAIDRLSTRPELRSLMAERALQHARNSLDYHAAMAIVDHVVDAALRPRW